VSTKNSLAENEEKRISWIGYSSDFAARAFGAVGAIIRRRCYDATAAMTSFQQQQRRQDVTA